KYLVQLPQVAVRLGALQSRHEVAWAFRQHPIRVPDGPEPVRVLEAELALLFVPAKLVILRRRAKPPVLGKAGPLLAKRHGARVPSLDARSVDTQEAPSIIAESHLPNRGFQASESKRFSSVLNIPDDQRLVEAGRHEPMPVRTE